MQLYTEIVTIKVSVIQKQTLDKMKDRKVKVSSFIRKAIAEKIKRDYKELEVKPKVEKPPF